MKRFTSLRLFSLLFALCMLFAACNTPQDTDVSNGPSFASDISSSVTSEIGVSSDAESSGIPSDVSSEDTSNTSTDATSNTSSDVSQDTSSNVSDEPISPPQGDTSSTDTSSSSDGSTPSSDTSDTSSSPSTSTEKTVPALKSRIPQSVIDAIPDYDGKNGYYVLNNNQPYFTEDELTDKGYEYYSSLDRLGRCGVCVASVGKELMPTGPRGSISEIKPTGWVQNTYSIVSGGSLYNRSHLIAFMLTGENANRSNLITGTSYFNQTVMIRFENMVCDYVKETGNHVLYRVTPIFRGNNLLAHGVTIEAYSVEDDGDGIGFCVYLYNVQNGIEIDYATGNNRLADPDTNSSDAPDISEYDFVANKSSKKFHIPSCSSVTAMSEKNKEFVKGTAADLIAKGYSPCGACHPDRQ